VKDQLFSGDNVAEALAAASHAIGVPQSALRYVVLETGRPGGLGLGAVPARIAVLLGESAPQPQQPSAPVPEDLDVYEGLWAVVGALSEALGRQLTLELEEDAGDLRARLAGPACELLLDDEAAALRALEHLLQRVWARAGDARRLRVDCEGYRERRDDALRVRAQDLAAAVRQDGVARTTDPLNAYERRIVHLALDGASGVQTYSVGEGKERRVTVAPAASDEG